MVESPFPSSFQAFGEEPVESLNEEEYSRFVESDSPFPSIYELENPLEPQGIVAPEMEEYVAFLNELYDEEFNDAIADLADEATEIYQNQFESEYGDPVLQKREASYLLETHFNPLVSESEAFVEGLTHELEQHDLDAISASEMDRIIDQYEPEFEGFLKKLRKKARGAFNKLKKKVKDTAKAVGRKFRNAGEKIKEGFQKGGRRILKFLRKLVKPLINRILKFALNSLPSKYRKPAQNLHKRLFGKEVSELEIFEAEEEATQNIATIQNEFDEQVAELLFAKSEADMDATVAHYEAEAQQIVADDAVDQLNRARADFIDQISQLEEGEDPTPVVENFIPGIMTALRLGLRLIGRQRIVKFLAKLIAKLIRKFVGKKYAPLLSQAIANLGIRLLLGNEVMPEDEANIAGAAVAATVEDTVRQVAALPDYVLDNEELLEGFVLEAFEKAAAANLPPVLSESTYEKHPELRETSKIRGTWLLHPLNRRRKRYNYKKYSRIAEVNITPEIARTVKTFCGVPLSVFLRDRLGLVPGRPVKARIHLYEAIPGTRLGQICQSETHVSGLGTAEARSQLHPLTPEAAGMILGESGLGREVSHKYLDHQPTTAVGQRFYYLEIPGAHPQMMPTPEGETVARHASEVNVVIDFPANQLRTFVFLSEADAQSIAVKLRRRAPIGMVIAQLHSIFSPKLKVVLSGQFAGHVKIIHGAVTPEYARGPALKLLPQAVTERFTQQVTDWLGVFFSNYLKQYPQNLITAAEDFADGITLTARLNDPPGLSTLGRALRGEPISLYSFNFSDGMPEANVHVSAGFSRE